MGIDIDVRLPMTVVLRDASNFLKGVSAIILMLMLSEGGFHETGLNF
jgi:hypothetical protein